MRLEKENLTICSGNMPKNTLQKTVIAIFLVPRYYGKVEIPYTMATTMVGRDREKETKTEEDLSD